MLWLGLVFPRLALEVFSRGLAKDGLLAVSDGKGTRSTLIAVNRAAEAQGIAPGQREAAAHAVADALRVVVRDERAELKALNRIAAWAGQFTSLVSIAPPQTILLEIGGSLHLFGGQEKLLTRIREDVQALGYTSVFAVAPTPLGASLLARAGLEVEIEALGALARRLGEVPLDFLDIESSILSALHDLGLRVLGECLRLPREGLARRFGPGFLNYLDRALGRIPDLREPYVPPSRFETSLTFPGEVQHTEGLLFGARRLLFELEGFLRGRDSGVQQVIFRLTHARPPVTEVPLKLSAPRREAAHLLAVLREQLERLELREPVLEIQLIARRVCPWTAGGEDLFNHGNSAREPAAFLIDRLQARLGETAVQGIAVRAEHRPERAWRRCLPGQASTGEGRPARPTWLLPAPLALEQYEGSPYYGGTLQLEQGPERIETGWWDHDMARDYFVARNSAGARFWVYRERARGQQWFLHGIFS